MADANTSITTPGKPSPSVKTLITTITNIDGLSQDGFSKITAIAHLALVSLEAPQGNGTFEDIAHALEAICGIGSETKECINSEAEGVGANFVNEGNRCRRAANEAYRAERASFLARRAS